MDLWHASRRGGLRTLPGGGGFTPGDHDGGWREDRSHPEGSRCADGGNRGGREEASGEAGQCSNATPPGRTAGVSLWRRRLKLPAI